MEIGRPTVAIIAFPSGLTAPTFAKLIADQNRGQAKDASSTGCSPVDTSKHVPIDSYVPTLQLHQKQSSSISPAEGLQKPTSSSSCRPGEQDGKGSRPDSEPTLQCKVQSKDGDVVSASLATVVRLVCPNGGSRTETVLEVEKRPEESNQVLKITNDISRKVSSARVSYQCRAGYSRFQWLLISLSWIVAVNGLALFLIFLALSFSRFSDLVLGRFSSTFVTINGIVSLLAAAYFCLKIRKYLA